MSNNESGSMNQEDGIVKLEQRLVTLQVEHRDLDQVIDRLALEPVQDELQLRRLKKRKLQLKDNIILLQQQLTPDIPA